MKGKAVAKTSEELRFRAVLAKWLLNLRLKSGLSAVDLAKIAGVGGDTLTTWEQGGGSMPSPFQLSLLRRFARTQSLEVPEL